MYVLKAFHIFLTDIEDNQKRHKDNYVSYIEDLTGSQEHQYTNDQNYLDVSEIENLQKFFYKFMTVCVFSEHMPIKSLKISFLVFS